MIESLKDNNEEDYQKILRELDFDILEKCDEDNEINTEEDIQICESKYKELLPEDQLTISGKKPKNRHNMHKYGKTSKVGVDEKSYKKKCSNKHSNSKLNCSGKVKRVTNKSSKVLKSFDLNKLKRIDRSTKDLDKVLKNGYMKSERFVYTPRKLK